MQHRRAELEEVQKKVDLYLSVNRFDAAEKILHSTLADYGSLANMHNLLGITYHRQSKFPDALEEFNKALAANPSYIEAALNMAATLCDLSRYDEAREIFDRIHGSTNKQKKQPDLVLGRIANRHATNGDAYEESGLLMEAAGEYRKALTLFSRMPDVKLKLAKLYTRLGQNDKAKEIFEELGKLDNPPAEALTWLGILYFKLGRKVEARQQFLRAKEIDPDNPAARAYLRVSGDWQTDSKPAQN